MSKMNQDTFKTLESGHSWLRGNYEEPFSFEDESNKLGEGSKK